MGVVTSSTSSTMSTFSLLSVAFGLFSLALICEGTLKEDFCTDVSFWDVIKYTSTTAKCCDTVLSEDCITKWADFVQGTTEIVEMKQTCEVKSSVNCRPVTVNNCVEVRFTECELKGRDSCYSQTVYEPEQEKIHQKKCLT